jgi:hypothetical protein
MAVQYDLLLFFINLTPEGDRHVIDPFSLAQRPKQSGARLLARLLQRVVRW